MGEFNNPLISQLLQFLPFILVFAVFYFLLILPQKKKEKEMKNMLANLTMKDEVITIGGIHGKVIKLKNDVVILEIGVGTEKGKIEVERVAINKILKKSKVANDLDIEPQSAPQHDNA